MIWTKSRNCLGLISEESESENWKDYHKTFGKALTGTSTNHASWHLGPADRKDIAGALVAKIIPTAILDLDLE